MWLFLAAMGKFCPTVEYIGISSWYISKSDEQNIYNTTIVGNRVTCTNQTIEFLVQYRNSYVCCNMLEVESLLGVQELLRKSAGSNVNSRKFPCNLCILALIATNSVALFAAGLTSKLKLELSVSHFTIAETYNL